jgi:hypothetical protein
MLGIFLIVCLVIFLFIRLKAYSLLKDDYIDSVELDSNGRTYNVCYSAMVLRAVSYMVALLGYIGCIWPYLFIEGVESSTYILCIVMFGPGNVLCMAYFLYLDIRNCRGYIKISTDEIEYKRRKYFSVKVSDIKAITPRGYSYQIHLKEKGKKPLRINLYGFYKRKEICFLLRQLEDYSVKVSGRDVSYVYSHRLISLVSIVSLLFYTSYCCIDYDFFKRDYTAQFNGLGSDSSQSENAWPYYVEAAVNYTDLEDDLQEIIEDSPRHGQLELTDGQVDALRKWFNENTSSWASLKKATSINYCNVTYECTSFFDITNRDDFSSPSDVGYGKIRRLYRNVNACRLGGVVDLDWLDLFQMQLISSKHFVNGKTFIDQLSGYIMLARSVRLLAGQEGCQLHDLQKTRGLLKEHFPTGVAPLSVEGEILMFCSTYDDAINEHKIPVQTPLNPMFLLCGSATGAEASVRRHYAAILAKAQKGIEVEPERFSIIDFPKKRQFLVNLAGKCVASAYKMSKLADANLLAGYFILDLEEYRLMKGCYPVDNCQLREAGLTCQLPDDPYADGKIIYRNEGQRAILYAVGPNAKDDGGYRDDEGLDEQRDDRIYWQRDLKEKVQ